MSARIVIRAGYEALYAEELHALLDRAGEQIVAEVQENTPVGHSFAGHEAGTLKKSIAHEVNGNVLTIKATAPYAAYVELGTKHMDPKPYLRPHVLKEREL